MNTKILAMITLPLAMIRLSSAQVRYALKALLDGGYVMMDGEQGSKNTSYRLKGDSKGQRIVLSRPR